MYRGGEALNKRASTPEEIAEIVIFLSSNAATNIIGQTIVCDGERLLYDLFIHINWDYSIWYFYQ